MAGDPNIAIEAGDTLNNLVDQFADPYAFIRELVQNSIDAGSTRIDVDFEYIPEKEPGKPGACVMHVNDTGEGMTREVIDTKLTRLFSSSKEDDFTKIGKFGIGFVSIFALEPKAVFVDTGRDGESWRIHFKEDRTFDRYVLKQPVEGTQIKWIKEFSRRDFDKFRSAIVERLKLWCKHAEAEIYVDGELMNEPFELPHPLAIFYETQGTAISAAPSHDQRPFFGYYNRGLTLAEGHEALIPGVEFKIRSRYLEHTLTRDNVIKDENYKKAMALLKEAVENQLRPALFKAAQNQTSDEILGYLAYHLTKLPDKLEQDPIIPTHGARKASIKELKKDISNYKELLYEQEPNAVTQRLVDEGRIVVKFRPGQDQGLEQMLRILAGNTPLKNANSLFASPSILANLPDAHAKLIDSAMRVLHRAGSPYRKLVAGDFRYPGSGVQDALYLPCDKPTELIRLDKKSKRGIFQRLFGWDKDTTVILNISHPLIEPNFRFKPELSKEATFFLAQAIISNDGLPPDTITRLLEAYLEEEAPVAD